MWIILLLLILFVLFLLALSDGLLPSKYRSYLRLGFTENTSADPKTPEAIQTMAQIDRFITQFINRMEAKYGGKGDAPAVVAMRLRDTYNSSALKENFPTDLQYTSYVLNKGDEIAFCLHPKDNPQEIHDFNLLQFVVLHELSHLANPEHGHPISFWKTFKFILQEAAKEGLYTPVDYSKEPVVYCGVRVAYNPYFDSKL